MLVHGMPFIKASEGILTGLNVDSRPESDSPGDGVRTL